MSNEQRTRIKDWLIIIATASTIVVNLGAVTKVIGWMADVNTSLGKITTSVSTLADEVEKLKTWKDASKEKWAVHDGVEAERSKDKKKGGN